MDGMGGWEQQGGDGEPGIINQSILARVGGTEDKIKRLQVGGGVLGLGARKTRLTWEGQRPRPLSSAHPARQVEGPSRQDPHPRAWTQQEDVDPSALSVEPCAHGGSPPVSHKP